LSKRILVIFLTVSVLFTSLLVLPVQKASAFTIPNMAKLTKIVRGIGERIGINWTSEALTATVGYIAGLDSEKGLSFVGRIPIMDGQINLGDGYEHYHLDPPDWLDGVGLIKEASDKLVPDAVVPIYGQCIDTFHSGPNPGDIIDTTGKYYAVTDNSATAGARNQLYVWDNSAGIVYAADGDTIYYGKYLGNYKYYIDNAPLDGLYEYYGSGNVASTPYGMFNTAVAPIIGNQDRLCNKTITNNETVNISNVNTTIINNIDNSVVTNNVTYVMDIITPADDTAPTAPLNPPLTPEEVDDIYPPVDTDHDGVPDDTDITPGGELPTPDDTGIFAKLFPILLILKLFGVLGSCLMYLLRMFTFIMTIPGIDAIPINNTAFDWFRTASIVGIKIYDVVTSLASVGLSFIVFRAIRRAYL
jgi:hypothetical protein